MRLLWPGRYAKLVGTCAAQSWNSAHLHCGGTWKGSDVCVRVNTEPFNWVGETKQQSSDLRALFMSSYCWLLCNFLEWAYPDNQYASLGKVLGLGFFPLSDTKLGGRDCVCLLHGISPVPSKLPWINLIIVIKIIKGTWGRGSQCEGFIGYQSWKGKSFLCLHPTCDHIQLVQWVSNSREAREKCFMIASILSSGELMTGTIVFLYQVLIAYTDQKKSTNV